MMDFKSGVRVEVNRMNTIAKALSDEQIQQAADYFGALKAAKWTEVKEAATVPKTFIGGGRMRYASPEGGTEPIGNRVITLPQDQSRVTKRDPHSGFVSYVPVGSIKKGEALVKTKQCALCHGEGLKGLGPVPPLAGRSPSYLMRQMYDMEHGFRDGLWTGLMKPVVANLSDQDLLEICAYVAAQAP
jgi:cytochrome c553